MQTMTDTFVWDKNYKNTEQMRPYLADFLAIKKELTDAGKYPYNDSFKGRIPGLAGSLNEDTGIYLLQTLADLERLRARTADVLARGGYRLTDRLPSETERGTLIHTGGYMGGTGWKEIPQAKVRFDRETDSVWFKLPRQRNWRTFHDAPRFYLFMPEGAQ